MAEDGRAPQKPSGGPKGAPKNAPKNTPKNTPSAEVGAEAREEAGGDARGEPRKGARDVAAALRRQITASRYDAEDRIPPERALADEFGVARGTVREALRQLEDDGFVERRAGSGTYVVYAAPTEPVSIVETVRPLELVDARFALEPQTCRLAVLHATDRDFARAEEALHAMETCGGDVDKFAHGDEAFHLALAFATHNALLIWIMEQVNKVRSHAQWGNMLDLTLGPETISLYNVQHREILEAIKARNPELAATRMRAHLADARQSLVDAAER